jgi:hypothetical protein
MRYIYFEKHIYKPEAPKWTNITNINILYLPPDYISSKGFCGYRNWTKDTINDQFWIDLDMYKFDTKYPEPKDVREVVKILKTKIK